MTSCLQPDELKRFVYKGNISIEASHHVKGCPLCQVNVRKLDEEKKLKNRSRPPEQQALNSSSSKGITHWKFAVPVQKIVKHRYVVVAVFIVLAGFLGIATKLFSNGLAINFGHKPQITALVKRGQDYQSAKKIDSFQTGDMFKIEVKNTDYEYILVMGMDEDGALTSYYPAQAGQSLPIPFETTLTLPEVFTFGGKNISQIVLGIFSKSPLESSVAEKQIREEFMRLSQKNMGLEKWKGNTSERVTSWFILQPAPSK